MHYDESMNENFGNKKDKTIQYRVITVVIFALFVSLLQLVYQEISSSKNFGATIDPASGMILQTFMSHPNSDDLSLTDRFISINDIPVSEIQPEMLMDSPQDSVNVKLMSVDGEIRQENLMVLPLTGLLMLEQLTLPIIGLLFFLPGLILVLTKKPRLADMHFMMFGFFAGVLLLMSQVGQTTIRWMGITYLLTSVFSTWSFIEFHFRYLMVVPRNELKWLFRGTKIITSVMLLYGGLFHYLDWYRELNSLSVVNMILDVSIIIILFFAQIRKKEFRFGMVRAIFLTLVVSSSPLIFFTYIPFLVNRYRSVSIIVTVIFLLIIPINYFILLMNQKQWVQASLTILSFTATIFVEQLLVNVSMDLLPNGLPDYRVPSHWLDYLTSIAVLGVFLLLYYGIYSIFNRLIYGNIVTISKRLYKEGYSFVKSGEVDRPVIQMARLFIREFFRYEYLNICLVDGTVIQFDLENDIKVVQFDEQQMRKLINELGNESALRGNGNGDDRIIPLLELAAVKNQFPEIFGDDPRYCYILFGTKERIGFIAAGMRRMNEPFDLREMQHLTLLLNQFGVVFENLLLSERLDRTNHQMRLAGQQMLQMRENERRRIARDMHDNIIQAITAFRYQLNELYDSDKLSISDVESDELQHNLLNITQNIRDICFDLRPPALDATGLQSAVVSLVESYHSQGVLFIDFKVVGESIINGIPEDVAICLYRVLQESLLNITKHAQTKIASIRLNATEEQIIMEVQDGGTGFTVPVRIYELVGEGHFGLMGAQEFLDTVNGEFLIDSSPGKGATIKAVIPLAREVRENGVFYDHS